jgi:hypothetical protein
MKSFKAKDGSSEPPVLGHNGERDFHGEKRDPFWSVDEKQGRYKKPRIEFFLANFIAGQIAGEVNLSKLFSEYKAFGKTKKYPTVAAELQEIARYGAIYRELVGRTGDSALATFSRKLLPWDVTTVFPLVLRVWSCPEMEEAEKQECLDWLLAFIVRRAVCGLTTKNYNKFFLSAIAHLEREGWQADHLISFLLAQKSDTGRFPRDDEFEQKWLNAPLYAVLQPMRTRAVLKELEIVKRDRFDETDTLKKDLTVEHVMPREWPAFWPLTDGTKVSQDQVLQAAFMSAEDASVIGQIVRRKRVRDTIGNLTLLTQPLNSSISHGAYEAKREALEGSLLVLNRELSGQKSWNEATILKRSKALLPVALGIWRLPAIRAEQRANA